MGGIGVEIQDPAAPWFSEERNEPFHLLQEIADSSGKRLGPQTLMAMGSITERYRLDAIELRGKFPSVYKPLSGEEWKRLLRLMESRRPGPTAGARKKIRLMKI